MGFVPIAHVPNRIEAEMVRGLLEAHGIPAWISESRGRSKWRRLIDPLNLTSDDFEPQAVTVHENDAEDARAILGSTPIEEPVDGRL